MEIFITQSIPREQLKDYKHYVNYLFRNENNVLNICRSVEDVIKSNQWTKNLPLKSFIVSTESVCIGDSFLAMATNKELNGNIYIYLGKNKEGIDLIDIMDLSGKKHISTKYLLDNAMKFERWADLADMQKLLNDYFRTINI